MNIEHTLKRRKNETGDDFDKRTINFIAKHYKGTNKEQIHYAIRNALAYNYAFISTDKECIGIQTDLYRDKFYIGR